MDIRIVMGQPDDEEALLKAVSEAFRRGLEDALRPTPHRPLGAGRIDEDAIHGLAPDEPTITLWDVIERLEDLEDTLRAYLKQPPPPHE